MWLPGVLFVITAISCAPTWLIARNFDRNAAPQFVSLSLSAVVLGVLFILCRTRTSIPRLVQAALAGLVLVSTASLLNSHNIINGLTGDTGRYTGLVSLFALIAIALFFSQVDDAQFTNFHPWLIAGIGIVDLLGLFQAWGWFTLPGDGGIGSTLGNLDFFAAWLGTGFPLFFWKRIKSRTHALALALIFVLSLWILVKVSAKQGMIDFLLLIPVAMIYLLRHNIKLPELSIKVWTGIGAFLVILWAEIIYLIPMAKLPFPGISGDANVRMRTDFWYSGFSQFVHHIFLGVGPDNYGNFYEKYRSLSSVKMTESVLSNDAHSAIVQTFATLGIFGVIAFSALTLFYIRALVVLITSESHRWVGSVAAVFSLVFFTNSAISPITLPNKFIFWAVAGYIIGASQRINPLEPHTSELPLRIATGVLVAVTAFISVNFALADIKFVSAGKNYKISAYLPCTIYFSQQLALSTQTPDEAVAAARSQVKNNPRCLEAQSILASAYINEGNWVSAKGPIYALVDIAPGRKEIVRWASIYALKAKDVYLQQYLVSQGLKLGVLTHR